MRTDRAFHWETWPNGWIVGSFTLLRAAGIPHAVTTRRGPDVRRVAGDTGRLAVAAAGAVGLGRAAFATQVHGSTVRIVRAGGGAGEADALCTDVPGLAVVGKSADCPLLLLADPERGAVGFAHASWRSTVAGIVPRLLATMVNDLGCRVQRILACMAPCIGPHCYEVGPEVEAAALAGLGEVARTFFRPGPRRLHFDLWEANRAALEGGGVPAAHIAVAGQCSHCLPDLLPSYRREGVRAGRFLALIGRPENPEIARKKTDP